ncbi:FRG domain-containing protein [Microbacterium paraoxydans]|uniref:FRG domain-containing protein n=1 Tax=Microbacterium paraoxydans TaxID=199592 RepID=UPI0021A4BA08|nr:FRG domain-containing protein [Microbacterium paraoxydans]MCT2224093.1 FRG domain-containing protein [Microbacterium paraoxydans]
MPEPDDADDIVLPPETEEQMRRVAERAAARLYPGRTDEILRKISPAMDDLMHGILQRHPLREQLDEMGDRIIESSPALAEVRERMDEVLRRSILPGGQWASLLDFSARAAANASSDEKLYPPPELDGGEKPAGPAARKENSPRAFFGKHAVTVRSIDQFLHVIATIQSNYSGRRLVWRGQQNAAWPVQSSLHRHLVEMEGSDGSEEHLVDYEQRAFAVASQWGIPTTPAMSFLSLLQHNGAPTRLLDVSVDPNVASWFAVEPGPKLESKAARVVVWALKKSTPDFPTENATPFWHEWDSEDLRRKLDWGTGTSMWPWFPPAAGNDRMRAQRAGFLIGASSIVTTPVADLYSEYFGEQWNTTEIANATSFLGVPVPYDRRPSQHAAIPKDLRRFVPFVTIHIPPSFKPTLRYYLEETAGLSTATIYPDLMGLVKDLKSPTMEYRVTRTGPHFP